MKNNISLLMVMLTVLLVILAACGNSSVESDAKVNTDTSNNNSTQSTDDYPLNKDLTDLEKDTTENSNSSASTQKNDNKKQEGIKNDLDTNTDQTTTNNSELNVVNKKDEETLSQYSSEQIEYARVWLQLGPNQDIDELIVQHIPAGTPLNPGDEADVSYPEDVIQLTGSRIVDGIVTYSGNGDGTINVYNVPLRWYGGLSRPDNVSVDEIREEMEGIIKNTNLVYVDTGDNEKIIELIKLLNVDY
uniref:hypothetical protein n=1 Tax=uncultured Allobacillus sp. TaxID=1638025 RepID=UPI0025953C6E|nr:hypothetical protein [uncultured Allobacillus sp.]